MRGRIDVIKSIQDSRRNRQPKPNTISPETQQPAPAFAGVSGPVSLRRSARFCARAASMLLMTFHAHTAIGVLQYRNNRAHPRASRSCAPDGSPGRLELWQTLLHWHAPPPNHTPRHGRALPTDPLATTPRHEPILQAHGGTSTIVR
jgi:hypothetical protein